MKRPFLILTRFALVLLATGQFVSCATSSLLNSRTRHVGSIHAIKECRADVHLACIVWQVENDSPIQTSVVELESRNARHGERAPKNTRPVPLVELSGETAALPKGQSLPCLGIWRVHSGRPDSPYSPRVRWISRERDFCVNLPARVANPGRIAARLPLSIAQDALFLGAIIPFSAVTATGGGYGGVVSPAIGAWEGNEGETALPSKKWGVE